MYNAKILTLCCLTLTAFNLVSCSSKKTPPEDTPPKSATSGWNYQKIRETRQAIAEDDSLRPPSTPESDPTMDCVVLSAAQKKKSGASGCKPLEANAGFGENMFCCER